MRDEHVKGILDAAPLAPAAWEESRVQAANGPPGAPTARAARSAGAPTRPRALRRCY